MSIQAEVQIEAGEFVATQDKGEVSSLLWRPPAARWLLVLGHGASTNMHHRILEGIAGGLTTAGIATFRYHFPYHGKRREGAGFAGYDAGDRQGGGGGRAYRST